jgi:hypothetical protein
LSASAITVSTVQEHELFGTALARGHETGVKGLLIGMDIGKQRQPHTFLHTHSGGQARTGFDGYQA